MPKIKKRKLTQQEQSELFKKEVQRMIDDGELNPIEAARVLDEKLSNLASQNE